MTGADLIALVKKQPIAFACGALIVGAAAALFLRDDAVAQAQAEFQDREKELQKIDLNVRFTAGLAEATEEMVEAGKQFDTRLVRAAQLANNLQYFYRLERETGVKLIDVRQLPIPAAKRGEARGAFAPVPFAVSAQGTFAQIHDLLRRLETGPHFVRFGHVSLAKLVSGDAAPGPVRGMLSGTINLEMLGTP